MKNIRSITLEKYTDLPYEYLEEHIYRNQADQIFVTALSFELEADEDSQYPLEDLLERFSLYVSGFIEPEAFGQSNHLSLELAGDAEDIRDLLRSIAGKRVYNTDVEGEDGQTYVKLMIE